VVIFVLFPLFGIFASLGDSKSASDISLAVMLAWLTSFILCLMMAYYSFYRMRIGKPFFFDYDIDSASLKTYDNFASGFWQFSATKKFWRITRNTGGYSPKYNAGVSQKILRERGALRKLEGTDYIKATLQLCTMRSPGYTLAIMPDGVLEMSRTKANYLDWGGCNFTQNDFTLVESSSWFLAKDAQIDHYNWQYSNRDGGPDRRFTNNWQLPAMRYKLLEFIYYGKELAAYLVSNRYVTEQFVLVWGKFIQDIQKKPIEQKPSIISWPQPQPTVDEMGPMEFLEITFIKQLIAQGRHAEAVPRAQQLINRYPQNIDVQGLKQELKI
jgi:hypothetical protein